MKKRITAVLLVVALLMGILPVGVFAADEAPTSGTCGETLTWTLEDGVLTISGTGDMTNYDTSSEAPWGYRRLITTLVIEDGVTSVGDYSFTCCSALTSVTIPSSVTFIGRAAFENCDNLTNITIPNGVTSIRDYAFDDCNILTSVTIPGSVTSIGSAAFSGCSNLTSITIPDSVTSIGDYAFNGCSSLASITISDGITSIEDYAFAWCSSLTSITIPDNVTSIGNCAFSGCSSLASITIPYGVTYIGFFAFNGCSGLTSITIPDSVTLIGEHAFYDCSNLTSVTISDSVTTICDAAFSGCSSLTSITIPDSVASIKKSAFAGCSNLTDVYYGGSESEWAAMSIDANNECLTNATIHYNSTGPDDVWEIYPIHSLEFDESYLTLDVGQTVNITATCKSTATIKLTDLKWSCNNSVISDPSNNTTIIGPTLTGETDTYWISTSFSGLKEGFETLTLSILDSQASLKLEVKDPSVNTTHTSIGTLYDEAAKDDTIDDKLGYITFDDTAYIAGDEIVKKAKEIVNNKELKDKRVVYKWTGYREIIEISSIYDALSLNVEEIRSEPGTLEYNDGKYTSDDLTINAKLRLGIEIGGILSSSDIEVLKNDLYLKTSQIKLTAQSNQTSMLNFGTTGLWGMFKKSETDIGIEPEILYYNRPVDITFTAKLDHSRTPSETGDQVSVIGFDVATAGKEKTRKANYFMKVVDASTAEQDDALEKLMKNFQKTNIQADLTSLNKYFDQQDVAVMEYVVKMLTLETIASYHKADDWAGRLGIALGDKLKDELLSLVSLSPSMIGNVNTEKVYAQYIGKGKDGKRQKVDLKIPVTMYMQGNHIPGVFNQIEYSLDNKKISDTNKTWNNAGLLTYYNLSEFADSMIDFVQIAYNQAWGDNADKCAEIIIGKPIEDLWKALSIANVGLKTVDIDYEFPSSGSDAIFKFSTKDTQKNLSVFGSANVYVYDSYGCLCGAIRNNEVDSSYSNENIVLRVDGNNKYVTLNSDDYSIRLVGADTGEMEYRIDEYENDKLIRTVTTSNIPLVEGKTYDGFIPESLYTDAEVYELISEDENDRLPISSDVYYDTDTPDVPDVPVPVYAISAPATGNGTITVSPKSAVGGQTVTITATPDEGYELDTLTVTDTKGNELELKDLGNGKYSFKMPYGKVSVIATFVETEPEPVTDPVKDCDKDGTCPAAKFTDVDRTAWYHDGVHYCISEGLMNGTGAATFEPLATTDRAMLVTILYRLEGEPAVGENKFTDVAADEWYTKAVTWAANNGIVKGYGDGKFGPTDIITREQMATILHRYAAYKGYDVTAKGNLSFTDADSVSDWAKDAMTWTVGAELINGVGDNKLEPEGNAQRAQIATILYRFCKNVVK